MYRLKKILHHLFIPHEGNNFKARAIHLDFLTYYLIVAIFLTFGFRILSLRSGDILGFATDITIDRLYQLTNDVRQKYQLPTLSYNEKLAQAAHKKATDMIANNYWSHFSPDGTSPWDFIHSTGYQYEFAGENLAKNFLFSQGVVDAWMNSSSHKENVLKKDYSEIGFSVMNGIINGEETTLVVQMFGKPLQNTSSKKLLPGKQNLEVEAKTSEPVIQGQSIISAQKKVPASPSIVQISFNTSLIFLLFLIISVGLDFYFASKLHIVRITGKNLAHLIFITFLLIGILVISKGAIL